MKPKVEVASIRRRFRKRLEFFGSETENTGKKGRFLEIWGWWDLFDDDDDDDDDDGGAGGAGGGDDDLTTIFLTTKPKKLHFDKIRCIFSHEPDARDSKKNLMLIKAK